MTDLFTESYWFDAGIQFECTECGACCTGGPGAVFLSDDDIDRFALHLQIDKNDFLAEHTHLVEGRISLREKENTDCIFLDDNRCSVHTARPTQCRTYPFWFDRMKSKDSFAETILECPGVGRGKTYHREEILEIMHQDFDRPNADRK